MNVFLQNLFADNNTLKLADTLKYKLKDNADMPIEKIKDKSPSSSVKNSPKIQKKKVSTIDFSTNGNNSENEHFSPSKY